MSEIPTTKAKQIKSKKYMLVRYGRMNMLGFIEHNESRIPKVNTRVVVKTDKGLELAHLVGQLSAYRAGQFRLSDDQIKKYFDDNDIIDSSCQQSGKFVRFATTEDISEERHLQKIAKEEMETCKQFVKEMNLSMRIVDAEHIFGGERIIFYFMSDGRIDFRDLVKKLAHEYQTRIEMRQIGSRDEAKILGDVETCGQQCCCQRFLKLLKPVNIRMAKMQKATLDPSKISGFCGRLKCCLRYEDKTYTELKKHLPKKNARVKTKYGEGKVVDTQILTQLVVIEYESGEKAAVPVNELEIISTSATTKQNSEDSAPDAQDAQDSATKENEQNNEDDEKQ
jgi:cell fate regulator YaaT (PSP1 superfamily)